MVSDAHRGAPPWAEADGLDPDFPDAPPDEQFAGGDLGDTEDDGLDPDFPDAPPDEQFADADAPDLSAAEAAPFATHCFDHSEFRSLDFTVDAGATPVVAATATTPPQFTLGAQTRFRTIAGLDNNFPRERIPTGVATEFLVTTRGRSLLDIGHLRANPANAAEFQIRIRGVVCHPASAPGSTTLPSGGRLPVAVLVHGNHVSISRTFADSGGARTTTVAGDIEIPARVTLANEVESFRGYRYLQEELARQGIVSISVDTNAANFSGSLIRMRADLVLAALDELRRLDRDRSSPLHRRLDFSKVAMVGHSRGGDAVAMAAELNRRRSSGTRYSIRAVVALAPTDFTGMTARADRLRMRSSRTASFLCIHGSHDGDVSGAFDPANRSQGWGFVGTGFRHYDRASTQRAMVFIHGATHNRFNTVWIDPAAHVAGSFAARLADAQADNNSDRPQVDPALPPSTAFPVPAGSRDARVLSDTQHRTLAIEYIGGWLRLWLLGQFAQQRLFIGDRANSLGTPIGLQWKLGRSIRGVDNFDDADPGHNVLGGRTTRPSFVQERLIELSNLPHSPHHDRVLEAGAPTGSPTYISRIPSGKRNWRNFSALTIRVAKHFPILVAPADITAANFPPNLQITLFDGRVRSTLDHTVIAPLNPLTVRPYHRQLGGDNLTKVHMQTWQIPLTRFVGSTGLSLGRIQAVEIEFGSTAIEPVHLDTLSLIKI